MRIKRTNLTVLLAASCLLLYGCDIGNMRPKPYVAVVNDEKIYLTELQDRMATELGVRRDPEAFKDKRWRLLREGILEILINEKVMLQRAEALSLKITDEELNRRIADIKKEYSEERFNRMFAADKIHYGYWREAQRRRLLMEKLVAWDVNSRVFVSDDEVRAYLEAHEKGGISAKRVHVLQILVSGKGHAEQVLKRLKRGENFANVARKESISPEAASGGDLGYFGPGVMPEDIDKTVFSLPVGKVSGIVKSPYGYHIFKVVEKNGEEIKRDPDRQNRVRTDLLRQKEAAEYGRWLKGLREKAAVKIKKEVLHPES